MAGDLPRAISEERLKHFGSKVDDLIRGRSLSRGEAFDLFRQILKNKQPDLQQGAFLAAITAKGATAEEIAGIWEAIYEVDTMKVRPEVKGPLAENCGTGMDSIKTFNISTAASIVAAAGGINMARHGSRAITSRCGTVDMLEILGVDVNCDVQLVKKSIEVAGIGIFNGMSGLVHPSALCRILSQIRFGTVLNIAGSLANPALPDYGVRGVYSREMVLPIAMAMKEIGYRRALKLSIAMTQGHKWAMFILDLSFVGWYLLGLLACGLGVLFVRPYYLAVQSELYAQLRYLGVQNHLCTMEELGFFPVGKG